MVMPLPAGLRPASPVSRTPGGGASHHDSHPRSPIKKLERDAGTRHGGLNSPQKLKAAVAMSTSPSPSQASSGLPARRAQVLQTILSLLDRDDAELQQLVPVLELLASLPPHTEHVLQRCLASLQQSALVNGFSDRPVSAMDHQEPAPRNSGRAKSPVTLRNCKEFLLACANEIHELEEVNPCFDYVEDTASDAQTPALRLRPASPWLFATFDYVSTADSSARVDDEAEDDDDDNRADQGSQLSEVLCRCHDADEAENAGRECLSLADRLAQRRAFVQWRSRVRSTSDMRATAAMYQAFSALTRHRADSRLSVARKQRAFHRMKLLVGQSQSRDATATVSTQVVPVAKPSVLRQLVLVNWELLVLLMIAAMIQVVG